MYIIEHRSMQLPHCLCCLSSPKYQLCFYLLPYCYLPSCCCLLSPCCLFYFPCFCGDGISPLPSMCELLTIEAITTFAFHKGKFFFAFSLFARLFFFSCMVFFFFAFLQGGCLYVLFRCWVLGKLGLLNFVMICLCRTIYYK